MQDRFRTRVWDIEGETYIYDAQFEPDYDFLVNDKKYIPEQCAGVKDKNGKLIYEGDILKITSEKYHTYEIQCVEFCQSVAAYWWVYGSLGRR